MSTPKDSPLPSDSASRRFVKWEGGGDLDTSGQGWWRFSPVTVRTTKKGMKIRLHWRRALVAVLAMVILGWVGLASGAYFFVKYRRGFTEVRYDHMLLFPWRQAEYRVARGEFLITLAKKQLRRNNLREAFYNVRVGSQLSPQNRDARMLLAQFYMAWQRPDFAQNTLVEGVEFNRLDREYLEALFNFLLQRQADDEVIRISGELLAGVDVSGGVTELVNMIAMARATALFFRGNYDSSEDVIRRYRLTDSADGQILALRIEWERGERDTALERLQGLTDSLPDNEQVYAQYAAYLRETGKDDELRRLCLLRQLSYPDRARPRIDLLYLYDKGKDEANVSLGVQELFMEFPKDGEVMVALGDFAANTGRPELARRVYDYCVLKKLNWEGPALMTVEAYLVSGRYREALEACRLMIDNHPDWGKRYYSVFNGLQAIANYGLGDVQAAQLFLNNFLNQAGVRADNLVAVSNRLVTVGAKDQARQVLSQAVRSDPLNQTALVGLIRLDLELDQVDLAGPNLRVLLSMRKPPIDLLKAAYDRLASDRYVFMPDRAALLDKLQASIQDSPGTQASR
jgi:tetratricopeptide (TPR) repeat protein